MNTSRGCTRLRSDTARQNSTLSLLTSMLLEFRPRSMSSEM